MSGFRDADSSFRKGSMVAAFAVAAIAAVAYSLTLAGYMFPGNSARLLVQWTGIDVLEFPEYPLWGYFVKLFGDAGSLSSIAFRRRRVRLPHMQADGVRCVADRWTRILHQVLQGSRAFGRYRFIARLCVLHCGMAERDPS